jgi:hypothetical protein
MDAILFIITIGTSLLFVGGLLGIEIHLREPARFRHQRLRQARSAGLPFPTLKDRTTRPSSVVEP